MKIIPTYIVAFLFLTHTIEAESKTKRNPITNAIDVALVKPPENNELCFSPDEPCAVKLAKFIESARTSLDIAIYDINEEQIVHQLLVASKKIPVRVIVDKRQAKGNHSKVGLLLKAGVSVRHGHQRGIMHNKFTIVDGGRIETGSFNYTYHAHTANQENQVYLSNSEIVKRYRERFEKIWETAVPAI